MRTLKVVIAVVAALGLVALGAATGLGLWIQGLG